jgi:hypothetical protein
MEGEAAILCYGWDGTEWIPVLVDDTGAVEVTS